MRTLLSIAALVITIAWMAPGGARSSLGQLDVSSVTAVTITGPAGLIRLSASRDGPYRAELRGQPDGWFAFWRSSWASNGCENVGSIRLDGTELRVDTGSRAWFGASDCRLELTATLPENVAVSIEQDATSSHLSGSFASLDIKSRAGDIALDGHAHDVSIEGNAIRARLSYARIEQDESIDLGGNAIDAELRFAGAEAVNYAVSGHASLVDSALPNKPGIKPTITVKGDFLRVSIRGG